MKKNNTTSSAETHQFRENTPNYFSRVSGQVAAVYILTNTLNNCYYIGSTLNLNDRMTRHVSQLKNQSHPNKRLLKDFKEIQNQGLNPMEFIQCQVVYHKLILVLPPNHKLEKISRKVTDLESQYIDSYLKNQKTLYNVLGPIPIKKSPLNPTEYVPLNAKPCNCQGKSYDSFTKASKALNISRDELRNRIFSDSYPDYYEISQEEYLSTNSIDIPKSSRSAKPVISYGIRHQSIYKAARANKVQRDQVRKFCSDPFNKNWKYDV